MIRDFLYFPRFCDYFQIANDRSNRASQLMSINQAVKRSTFPVVFGCLCQQVIILCEENAFQFIGSIEQPCVIEFVRAIVMCSQYIYTAIPRSRRPFVMALGT